MATEEIVSKEQTNSVCTPCMTENFTVAASMLCEDCQEFLCPNCVKHHLKLGITKHHSLTELDGGSPRNLVWEKTEGRCHKHFGKVIAMFCPLHEEIGCHECMSEHHTHCGEIMYIPERAKGINRSPELHLVKEDLESTSVRLKRLSINRQKDLDMIGSQRDKILQTFSVLKQRVIKKLEGIETSTKANCENIYSGNMNNIQSDISACNGLANTLDTMSDVIRTTHEEPILFLQLMRAKRNVSAGIRLIDSVSQKIGRPGMLFNQDPRLDHLLDDIEVFGQIHNIQRMYDAKFMGKYSVIIPSDKEKSDIMIFSCTHLPDGRVIVTDYTNKRLKILSAEYKYLSHLELCGSPYGACVTGESEVAVCIFDKCLIQLVGFRPAVRPTRSFSTELKCEGVAFDGNQLFVTVTGEPTNQVRIYAVTGSLQRIIEGLDGKPLFTRINQIVYCSSSSRFYVTDMKRGVICLDKKGTVLSVMEDNREGQPTGIAPDGEGGFFIADFKSNRVMHFGHDLRKINVVLKGDAGIKEPLSLCFDTESLKLSLTLAGSKFIHVFHLHAIKTNQI